MPVILFDGECALCQRVVRGLLRLDGEARMRFAPLQGAAGQAFLRARGLPTDDFDSLVFVPDWDHAASGEYLMRTDGLIGALKVCGGIGGRAGRDPGRLAHGLARRRLPLGRAFPPPDLRRMDSAAAGPAGMGRSLPAVTRA